MKRVVVTVVRRTVGRGLYAPATVQGDLLVNGIKVSGYMDAVQPAIAHGLLLPLRHIYSAGFKHLESKFRFFECDSWPYSFTITNTMERQ